MLIAASVMSSSRGYVGTSMTKTWLMRRLVRRPVGRGHHRAHQLVGVQAALHQRLDLARARHRDRARRGRVAVLAPARSGRASRSRPSASATARIFASGPDQHGHDQAAPSPPRSRPAASRGRTDARRRRSRAAARRSARTASRNRRCGAGPPPAWRRPIGDALRRRDAPWAGRAAARGRAGSRTGSRTSMLRSCVCLRVAVTVAVSVSPMWTRPRSESRPDDRAARPGQAAVEEARDQRDRGGARRRHPVAGVADVEVEAVDVACGERERLDVGGGQRARDRRSRAHVDLVERAVGEVACVHGAFPLRRRAL